MAHVTILRIPDDPTYNQLPITPTSPSTTIDCHDIFPNATIREESNKYNPLIQTLRTTTWNVKPLIIITARVSTIINNTQKLMKNAHLIAFKYLT
jgi:hypothetical protein